jgi:Cd2+/Zn2+-exporting ATPase
MAGKGARGVIAGATWSVVKPAAVPAADWPEDLRAALSSASAVGQTLVVLAEEGRPRALLGLSDEIRSDAAAALAKLRELGISEQVMLTGDRAPAAEVVARTLGLSRVFAELQPDEKLEQIGRLRAAGGPVAMVGDGVNDAPALAAADVGVAMGAAGAEVALETADVALLGNSLERLPTAVQLARASNRLIRQNLIFSIAVICIVAPLAALGLAHLGVAVVMHEGSTVVVVLNALRLLRFRP